MDIWDESNLDLKEENLEDDQEELEEEDLVAVDDEQEEGDEDEELQQTMVNCNYEELHAKLPHPPKILLRARLAQQKRIKYLKI